MRYLHYGGVGERIKERLLALGYDRDGRPDIARFLRVKRYDPRYFYRWVNKDSTPTGYYLERLIRDLGTTRAWLLHGEGPEPPKPTRRRPVPIRGGSAQAQPLHEGTAVHCVRLIGSLLREWWGSPALRPAFSGA